MSDDVGDPDPRLAAALAAGRVGEIRAELLSARLLLPIVAVASQDSTDMAVPALIGADGRQALPAFTSLTALHAWRADARPVPMPGSRAVLATVESGYAALVLDVAGPVDHVVTGDDLALLAAAARQLEAGLAGSVRVIDES